MGKVSINIITCPQWGARQPKSPIQSVGKSVRCIMHHTAGHHAEISLPNNESTAEAKQYARAIQDFHMDTNGWIDSGHNFLVCRNGDILQGRWITVSAIEAGHMVDSAHCPGQNEQIGIEHEHLGSEAMTDAQRSSSARLQAWIASLYGLKFVLDLEPHKKYYNTSCPANLVNEIPHILSMANQILKAEV